MKILGLSCHFHDAAAALIVDGQIVAAAEEERFSRLKHDNRFPVKAIETCLAEAGLSIGEIDRVCFYEKPLLKLERVLEAAKRWPSPEQTHHQLAHVLAERAFVPEALSSIGYEGPVDYVEHHLAHAASAFYISGFDAAAILTIDGVGEWDTTALYDGEGQSIRKLSSIRYPHSLGLFYSAMTAFLGFKVNNDEYKVMGLASYGEPKYVDALHDVITLNPDGSVRLNLDYFSFQNSRTRMFSDALVERFWSPRVPESVLEQRHKDFAASVQQILEEGVLGLAREAHRRTGRKALCLAGGVALNCVSNARLLREGPFESICVQPAAGDSGGALGAALYAWHSQHPGADLPKHRHNTLLGPQWDNEDELRAFLDGVGADYELLDEGTLCDRVAGLLAESHIIGWHQGRMEYGPRALGNRSILANPANPKMKEILNARVKFREGFRPFAPAVLEEKAADWFQLSQPSPHMLFAPPVRPGVGERLPSITHVDGTARVQTVSATDNPRFHRLLQAFDAQTGVPVLINTSFNVRGEPIVCTPEDAWNCFQRSDIDYLVIDRFLIEKDL